MQKFIRAASARTTSTTVAVPDTPHGGRSGRHHRTGAMSNPLSDMEKPDVIFCIGTNMTECHPVAATRLKKAMRDGAKLIVADPRKHPARGDGRPVPAGSGSAPTSPCCSAMAHVIAREGLVDQSLHRRAHRARRRVPRARQGVHARVGGVDLRRIRRPTSSKAASGTARPSAGAIYYTLGITEHICGVDNVQSLCNLVLMTGNIGRVGHRHQPDAGPEQHPGRRGLPAPCPTNLPGLPGR